MKKTMIKIGVVSALLIMIGCRNENKSSSTEYPDEVIDTVSIINIEPETVSSFDQTAIGNIHMNIDESQFEVEKEEFLSEHPNLGGLTIKSIKGIFYDYRLAAIEIISDQQDIHSKILHHDMSYDGGWLPMYYSKYQNVEHRDIIHYFSFEKAVSRLSVYNNNQFLIEVSDVCDSPHGHNDFEEIINYPPKQCYGHNLKPLRLDESNNVTRMNSVFTLLGELPKERAEYIKSQYDLERSNINRDNPMVKISSEAAIDRKYFNLLLPEVQAQRNRLLNLHKDDPSWSFIIIYYKPLLEKYNRDQEKMKEQRDNEKKQELDII